MLLQLTLLVSLLKASSSLYYIKSNSSTPAKCANQTCLTLDQYMEQAADYFTSASTFVFLAGSHNIQGTLNLTSLSNIILMGETDSDIKITCSSGVTIRCKNIRHLTIEGVTFVLLASHQNEGASVLNIVSSSQVLISNVRFFGRNSSTKLHALRLIQSLSIMVKNCNFESIMTGAIQVVGNSRLVVMWSNFTENTRANGDGGAIYASNAHLHLKGVNFFPTKFCAWDDKLWRSYILSIMYTKSRR